MPYVIAAETVNIHRDTLAKHLPGYKNHQPWKEVWAQILDSPRLLRIHWELVERDPAMPRHEAAS